MNNEELQSRREFFKKAAKGALPFLALGVFGPSFLTSCGGGGDDEKKNPEVGNNNNGNTTNGNNTSDNSNSTPTGNGGGSNGPVPLAGTIDNPFSVSEAVAYARTLEDGMESSSYYYIKGVIDDIYSEEDDLWQASFTIKDDNGEIFAVPHASYRRTRGEYGDPLRKGDVVIVWGKITNHNGVASTSTSDSCLVISVNGDSFENHTCTDCTATCHNNCYNTCSNTCEGGCSGTCEGYCSGTCEGYCTGECSSGCTGGCSSGCTGGCSSGCTGGAKGGCGSICSFNCTNYCGTAVTRARY